MNEPKTITAEIEVVGSNTIEAIERATVDVQIATAHKFPRSLQSFVAGGIAMATIDEETAESCLYVRPVGGGKNAEGMSVRMAEIVAANYGNLRYGAMIIEQTERQVKARGFAHDLEKNVAATSEVVESTVKKDGTPYDERMRIVIAKSCIAKASRDAIFRVVPRALAKPLEAAVRKLLSGDAASIGQRRAKVMAWLRQNKVEPARMFAVFGIQGEADITLDILDQLTGLRTAINEGDATYDEAFPKIMPTGRIGSVKTPTQAAAEARQQAAAPAEEQPQPDPAEKQEAPSAEKPKKEKKPEPAGPTADELRKEIITRLTAKNLGKSRLMGFLAETNVVPTGTTWESLIPAELQEISDALDTYIEHVLKG